MFIFFELIFSLKSNFGLTLGPFTSIPGTLTSISDCSIFIFPFASGILTPGTFTFISFFPGITPLISYPKSASTLGPFTSIPGTLTSISDFFISTLVLTSGILIPGTLISTLPLGIVPL